MQTSNGSCGKLQALWKPPNALRESKKGSSGKPQRLFWKASSGGSSGKLALLALLESYLKWPSEALLESFNDLLKYSRDSSGELQAPVWEAQATLLESQLS